MKTLVIEQMPDLFWKKIRERNLSSHFTESADSNDEIEIIIIRTKTDFNKYKFAEFPNLKMIIRAGSGFDNIDIHEASKMNVIVCNTPDANALSAYEQTLSFIFALIKQHEVTKNRVLDNIWRKDFKPNWEVSDINALIVGVGRVGTQVAKTLEYLGAQVKGVDPYLSNSDWENKKIKPVIYKEGINWCNLLTFHCPLSDETENYFNEEVLASLNNPIWLINTSRGKVVHESTITQGLSNGKVLGFAADVFGEEPWIVKKFANNLNVILSPHVGAYTKKAKMRMSLETLEVWSDYVNMHHVSNKADVRFLFNR